MMRTDVRRGFTLIELLVVIAVIAILASILFPVFAKATAKAKQTACLSNVRQLTTALLMFTQDNKNTYPTVDPSDLTKSWAGQLESFVGNRKIYRCPLDDNGDGYVSYVMNGMLVAYDGTGIQTSAVKDPADVGAFVDGTSYKFPESGVLNWSQDSHSGSACTYVERHSLCQSYCDGHAEPLNGPKLCDPVSFYAPLGQAFYAANSFGWVNNPSAGVVAPGAKFAAATDNTAVTIMGSTTAVPLWSAAAAAWNAAGGAVTLTCTGSGHWKDSGSDLGASDAPAGSANCPDKTIGHVIATDAYGIAVPTDSRLNLKALTAAQILTYLQGTATGTYHLYTRNASSGTRMSIEAAAGGTVIGGKWTVNGSDIANSTSSTNANATVTLVTSAADMATKVAADPYGIGFISVGDGIDPIKLQMVNFNNGSKTEIFDRAAVANGNWDLIRPVVAAVPTTSTNATVAGDMLTYARDSATFQKSLIYSTGFFPPALWVGSALNTGSYTN